MKELGTTRLGKHALSNLFFLHMAPSSGKISQDSIDTIFINHCVTTRVPLYFTRVNLQGPLHPNCDNLSIKTQLLG